MPTDLIFHERNAFAFDRAQQNHRRLVFGRVKSFESRFKRVEIVTVNRDDLATEGGKFFVERRPL